MSDEGAEHKWAVGDVCTCEYLGIAGGMLYVVVWVEEPDPAHAGVDVQLKIKPIWGFFQDIKSRKTRTIGAGWCTHRSLVDLGTEYVELGNFIRNLATTRGA